MPFVPVDGPDGPWNFCYAISTPTKASAETIDPDVPTIFFIHSNFTWKETFQRQFENPTLRQFNLVTFDHRGCGETLGLIKQDPYRPSHITDDACKIFEALKLPPCHVFGIELGSYVALDLAARHPEWVLSMTLCSPSPPVELEDVMSGRTQMTQYFEKHLEGKPSESGIGKDAIMGAAQLAFNLIHTQLVHALVNLTWETVKRDMTGSVEKVNTVLKRSLRIFRNQTPLGVDHLKKIRCPITIIHCTDNIAYSVEIPKNLRTTLLQAGLQVKPVVNVPGPHFACVTHPDQINSVIFDNVLSNSPGDVQRFKVKSNTERLETPFLLLARHGYHGADDSDMESRDCPWA
ncbi:Alpha/Beta hydrolase protein [Amanita rubescens]|nr:Alpha/Beta hydrolase protein [Amanita rubescens]